MASGQVAHSARRVGSSILTCCRWQKALRGKLMVGPMFAVPCCGIKGRMTGRIMRDDDHKRPAPWPYKEKQFRFWHRLFDNTVHRFDDNSKVIVVDGPIASGKSHFVKALAEDLDMKAFPEVTMDSIYINDYGFDLRQLDPKLPDSCKSCDIEKFYKDPYNPSTTKFQFLMYQLRCVQYSDALAHLLSTGQGVILERSAYSDFVFLEAMHECGYVSSAAVKYYDEVKTNTIVELLHPHLAVYLDVPVPVVMDRIKKRNLPHEANSPVLTEKYLAAVERSYKQNYLKYICDHSEVLVYDWSNYGDVEIVVEDLERMDFDIGRTRSMKWRDWRVGGPHRWVERRLKYTTHRGDILHYFNVPNYTVPEMNISGEDMITYKEVMDTAKGQKFLSGFNKDAGDKGIFFKMFPNYWDKQNPQFPTG